MKKLFFLLALTVVTAKATVMAQTNEDRKDRVIASYLLAFGELPKQAEIDYWTNDPLSLKTVNDLLNEHKKNIRNDVSLQDRAIKNSYQDAFGTMPDQGQYAYWRQKKNSYMDLMENHMRFFRDYPAEFEKMVRLTYKNEFKREAKQEEINNWKSWGIRSYLAIVQEHQKNKKAGMFAETKPASKKINTSKASGVQAEVSSKVAAEVKIAAANVIATGGGNVIATGGGNVISTGGGNVISTGGGN